MAVFFSSHHYPPPIPDGTARRLTLGWLSLALASLVGSGLVVILIILARTPLLHPLLPWLDSFTTALVIHVDLSVLIWFLAFAGVIASLTVASADIRLGWIALALAALGAILITMSPFVGAGTPYKNNYIPVLANSAFFLGLGAAGIGFVLMATHALLFPRPDRPGSPTQQALDFGIRTGLLIILVAALSWLWSMHLLPANLEGEHRYELLFWSSGHVIQFTHAQLLMAVWLMLAAMGGAAIPLAPGLVLLLFGLGFLPILATPVIQWVYPLESIDHRQAFTDLMKYGGLLGLLPMGLAATIALAHAPRPGSESARTARLALFLSLLLTGCGGGLGFLIQAVNVTIPAHYHGSIVAVTVAYMGLAYHLVAVLGFRPPSFRAVRWQLLLYAGGTLLHALGLAISGGYGVQRKTVGLEQGLNSLPKQLAMGAAGIGGLIAVIGGIFFLVLMWRAFSQRLAPHATPYPTSTAFPETLD